MTSRLAAAAVLGALVMSVTACTGGGDDDAPVSEGASPEEVMEAAKAHLDETSGVEIRLSTEDAPDDGDFLASAEGTIVADPPAFEGVVAGRVQGIQATDIDVVAIGGDLYVDVPIVGWDTYDPEDFCAPDPALLLDPDTGVSPILTATEGLEAGESERGGADNTEVLTPYTGTVPGDSIRNILPCAEGDEFDAAYRVDSDGYVRDVEITGEFFAGTDAITYTIELLEYDVDRDISAPE
jgi:lipoprotein LprG